MKYLIAGLGNIGAEYANTRHNIGFAIADAFAKAQEASFRPDTLGDLAECRFKGRSFILLKPSTYMNRSGKAVRYWMQKKSIPLSNVLVVVDDLQLPFGRIRIRPGGSDGGHNGLRDLNEVLGTTEYPRLRIGIGSDFRRGSQVDFVLGEWSREEAEKLPDILARSVEVAKSFATIGMEQTMNLFNSK
jgi:PTH1 family peptidyl-tRNA hydrolase